MSGAVSYKFNICNSFGHLLQMLCRRFQILHHRQAVNRAGYHEDRRNSPEALPAGCLGRNRSLHRKERAVLALTETMTLISNGHVPDTFIRKRQPTDRKELAAVIMTVVTHQRLEPVSITTIAALD